MKRGFTLMELLGVIVILALLVIVAVPRIQDAIKVANKSLDERSIDLYGKAAAMAVNIYELEEGVPPQTFSDIEPYIDYSGQEVDCKIKKLNSDGTIYLSRCVTDGKEIEGYSFGKKSICIAVTEELKTTGNIPEGNYIPGDEYLCEVAKGKEYTFFVLSTEGDKVNLIMDSNIDSNGEPTKDKKSLSVPWSKSSFNTDGPINAFDYLHRATSFWTNIPNIHIDYSDEGNVSSFGYGSIKTDGDIIKITDRSGVTLATYKNLKARLPKSSEIQSTLVGCSTTKGMCPLWSVNYLNNSESYYLDGTKSNANGYWILSSVSYNETAAWFLKADGFIAWYYVDGNNPGIRPVITLSKDDLT